MNLLDWFLDLFRDPVLAQEFVNDPDRTMASAGFSSVTTAQVQTVAAAVAPAAALSGGHPVYALQQAVAESHGIPFVPQQTFAAAAPDVLSNNEVLSPHTNTVIDHSFDLSFGDVTFGDKTTNVADHGGVVVNGNTHGDVLTDGSVKQTGAGNTANTGDIHSGSHSPVIVGTGNDVHDNSQAAGGDIINGNSGNIIKDNDMSGGHGGGAHAGGGIFGGGSANAGGGSGGSVVINDNSNHSTNSSSNVFGDQTNVNAGGNVHGGIDASHHDDSSVHTTTTTTTVDDHSNHQVDNSVHQDIHQGVDMHVF
jgi:hypothetical protein